MKRRVAMVGLAALLTGRWVPAARAGAVDLPVESAGAFRVPVRSLAESRLAATVRQRHDFSCGSAALSTLLTHHYGRPAREAEIFDAMMARGDAAKIGREGFSLLDLKRELETRGYEADGFEEPVERLREVGIPAIVLIDAGGYHHFVVVKGVRDGRVLLGDPAVGTRVLPLAAFEASQVNRVLFVVSNHRAEASFDRDVDWRDAPVAPLAGAIGREGLGGLSLPRLGSADF